MIRCMAMGKSVIMTMAMVAAFTIMTKRRYPMDMTNRMAPNAVIITKKMREKRKKKKLLLNRNMTI